MFAARYFAPVYFAPDYFCEGGDTAPVATGSRSLRAEVFYVPALSCTVTYAPSK